MGLCVSNPTRNSRILRLLIVLFLNACPIVSWRCTLAGECKCAAHYHSDEDNAMVIDTRPLVRCLFLSRHNLFSSPCSQVTPARSPSITKAHWDKPIATTMYSCRRSISLRPLCTPECTPYILTCALTRRLVGFLWRAHECLSFLGSMPWKRRR
jgi:hypothetical protein